jgi:hypothetical protein
MRSEGQSTQVVIGLSAVILALRDGDGFVLTVRPHDAHTNRRSAREGLPFGPFDPAGHRTFELALREFVARQTRFDLGYVEQLYTFGDQGRDAPLADVGAGAARVISVGYLALAPATVDTRAPDTTWSSWSRFFPWEDWRRGRPEIIDEVIWPALETWAGRSGERRSRAALLFAMEGARWNEERVLDRYELLYDSGLAPEAARDRDRVVGRAPEEPHAFVPALGEPMISDHRRILATALGRLRGKLKYRPVAYEFMGDAFTLSALQRAVETIAGVALHKQNFRRAVERSGMVEGLGRIDPGTGGRPAELFRFRRELLAARAAGGLSLPLLRES